MARANLPFVLTVSRSSCSLHREPVRTSTKIDLVQGHPAQTCSLTLSVPQDFHGCTQPFFIYAQNIMVYSLTAHNYVSLKDNPNKVYIKLKGIGFTIWKCKVKSFESRFMCFRKDRRKKEKKRLNFFFLSSYLSITLS